MEDSRVGQKEIKKEAIYRDQEKRVRRFDRTNFHTNRNSIVSHPSEIRKIKG